MSTYDRCDASGCQQTRDHATLSSTVYTYGGDWSTLSTRGVIGLSTYHYCPTHTRAMLASVSDPRPTVTVTQ